VAVVAADTVAVVVLVAIVAPFPEKVRAAV
jgi:hypothetical protein